MPASHSAHEIVWVLSMRVICKDGDGGQHRRVSLFADDYSSLPAWARRGIEESERAVADSSAPPAPTAPAPITPAPTAQVPITPAPTITASTGNTELRSDQLADGSPEEKGTEVKGGAGTDRSHNVAGAATDRRPRRRASLVERSGLLGRAPCLHHC